MTAHIQPHWSLAIEDIALLIAGAPVRHILPSLRIVEVE